MKLSEVTSALEDPTVWDNPKRAQELGKEKKSLEDVVLVTKSGNEVLTHHRKR